MLSWYGHGSSDNGFYSLSDSDERSDDYRRKSQDLVDLGPPSKVGSMRGEGSNHGQKKTDMAVFDAFDRLQKNW